MSTDRYYIRTTGQTGPGIAEHLADATDAHDASAISVLDTAGNYAGDDAEEIFAELPGLYGGQLDPVLSEVASVSAGNSPSHVIVQGDYAYVAVSTDNVIKTFDISDPSTPTEVDSISVATGPTHLAARGKYVFCWSQGSGVMTALDASDPTALSSAGTVTTRAGQRFALLGRYAVVGGPESGGSANTLSVIDTADVTAMAEVGSLVVGSVHRNICALSTHLVAVASRDDNTLYLVSIADPRNPVLVGSLASLTQTLTPLCADPFFDRGRPYLYAVGYGDGKLYTVDCSNPSTPVKHATVTVSTTGEWLASDGGRYLFMAIRGTGSIDVIDIGNPAKPVLVQTLAATGTRFDRLAYANGYVFAPETASTGKLWTFKVAGGRRITPPDVRVDDVLNRTGIIAHRSVTPTSDLTTTSTTFAAIDDSKYYWTFTAPRSGKVRLCMDAVLQGSASSWGYLALATGGAEVSGNQRAYSVDSGRDRTQVFWTVTGLTPGASYTYTVWQASGTSGQTTGVMSNNTNGRGDVFFTVEALPA